MDYRKINEITISNLFPLPNLKKLLERVSGYKFYAKFDLKKGYHQLLVAVKFSGAASRWSTIDQEAYAVFFALKHWEQLWRGHKFLVETDHRNLVYIQKSDVGRVARWRLALQEFDFVLRQENVVADARSRCCLSMESRGLIEKVHNDIWVIMVSLKH